jgi:hypothetical protein
MIKNIKTKEDLHDEELQRKSAMITAEVTRYVQDVVDTYNIMYGTKFKDVHSCSTYKDIESYSHREFCAGVVAFNAAVWDAARAAESMLVNIEYLLHALPKYNISTNTFS